MSLKNYFLIGSTAVLLPVVYFLYEAFSLVIYAYQSPQKKLRGPPSRSFVSLLILISILGH